MSGDHAPEAGMANVDIYMMTKDDVPEAPQYEPPAVEGMDKKDVPLPPPVVVTEGQPPPAPYVRPPFIGFADFIPGLIQAGRKINDLPIFEDFKILMAKVNHWLGVNPHFQVVRCEVLDRKVSKQGVLDVDKTIFSTENKGNLNYLRGIRLWITENVCNLPVQQVFYMNVVPNVIAGSVENMDQLLSRLNLSLRITPIQGRILNVDCNYVISYGSDARIDPDNTYKRVNLDTYDTFVQVMRVFYVYGPPEPVEIEIVDFVPGLTDVSKAAIQQPPTLHFEPFTNVMMRFNSFASSVAKSMRIINVQTLSIVLNNESFVPEDRPLVATLGETVKASNTGANKINSRKMWFGSRLSTMKTSVQFLRVCCVKPGFLDYGMVTCRTFHPVRFNPHDAEFMAAVLNRVNTWLAVTGAVPLTVETVPMPYSPHVDQSLDIHKMYTNVSPKRANNYCSVIRLFIKGSYVEPPPNVLPPAPQYQQKSSTCTIL